MNAWDSNQDGLLPKEEVTSKEKERVDIQEELIKLKSDLILRLENILQSNNSDQYSNEMEEVEYYLDLIEEDMIQRYGVDTTRQIIGKVHDLVSKDIVYDSWEIKSESCGMAGFERDLAAEREEKKERKRFEEWKKVAEKETWDEPEIKPESLFERRQPRTHAAGSSSDFNTNERETEKWNEWHSNRASERDHTHAQRSSSAFESRERSTNNERKKDHWFFGPRENPAADNGHLERTIPQNQYPAQNPPIMQPFMVPTYQQMVPQPTFTHPPPQYSQIQPAPHYSSDAFVNRSYAQSAAAAGMYNYSVPNMMPGFTPIYVMYGSPPIPVQNAPLLHANHPSSSSFYQQQNYSRQRIHREFPRRYRKRHQNKFKWTRETDSRQYRTYRSTMRESTRRESETSRSYSGNGYYRPPSQANERGSALHHASASSSSRSSSTRDHHHREETKSRRSKEETKNSKEDRRRH